MKKLYTKLLMAVVAMGMSLAAKAQVTNVTDLYGTYKMTCTIDLYDDAYQDVLKNECDVLIYDGSSAFFQGEICGMLGIEDAYQQISKFGMNEDEGVYQIKITNPNGGNWDAWGSQDFYMADAEGNNPFGATGFGPLYYTVSDDGSLITIPDFTLVKMNSNYSAVEKVIAKVTDVQLCMESRQQIEISDISGDYHFTSTNEHIYGTEESFPNEFDMKLSPLGIENKSYEVQLSWPGVGDKTLYASFDGKTLSINIAETMLGDYLLSDTYDQTTSAITFNYVEGSLILTSGILLKQFKEAGELEDIYENVYWCGGGAAVLINEETETSPFVGVYDAQGTIEISNYETPASGEIEIVYDDRFKTYFITKFLGYDTYQLNYGGIILKMDEFDPSRAYIEIDYAYSFLQFIGDEEQEIYKYYDMRDVNGTYDLIPVTLDEDGKLTIGEFMIYTLDLSGEEEVEDEMVAYYSSVVGQKRQKESTAVRDVEGAKQQGAAEYYTLSGVKTSANQKGIMLMKKDGKVMKMLKK
ncbi:MAG: hypothetical protein KBT12_06140 [Bacteroidales bacterium]|nr:hypothetical protein [Candidatus Physcousia equi]